MSKKQTPMMEQYLDIKSRYSEELLFFRLAMSFYFSDLVIFMNYLMRML